MPASCETSATAASVSTELAQPLFEDISDAEDEPPQSPTPPPPQRVENVSQALHPASLFHSAVRSSTFNCTQPYVVPNNDCSSSLPAVAISVASSSQFFPAVSPAAVVLPVPEIPFCAKISSPPPLLPLEDMITAGVLLPRAMTPLTIDTGSENLTSGEVMESEFMSAGDVKVMEQENEITDTSHAVESDVNRSLLQMMSDVVEQSESALSGSPKEDMVRESLSPSPPKIPRLRIVMGTLIGDTIQSATSPGSAASLPYVVTVNAADQSDLATSESPPIDVTDDVMESSSSSSSSLMKSGSLRLCNKDKHSAVTKVHTVMSVLTLLCQ